MKLDLDFSIVDLAGTELKDNNGQAINAAQYIANIVYNNKGSEFDSLKGFELARNLFNNRSVEIDTVDAGILEKIIRNLPIETGVKGQILMAFFEPISLKKAK